MEELLRQIVSKLVDNPDQIQIDSVPGEHATILQLKVAQGDTGKVIGKQGRTADALRTILKSVGGKLNKTIVLEIRDSFEQD